jgi:hypothetical protein
MIAKFKGGFGFKGLIDYANKILNGRTNILASSGVSLTSNKTIAASFTAQAKTVRTNKPFVGHLVLAFSPKDFNKLSNDRLSKIAQDFMNRMGINDTQFIIFRHYDQPHPHIHVVYNRVNNFGNEITSDTNFRKSAAVSKAITREYGLTFGKGKDDVRRDRLKGKDKIKYKIYDTVKAEMQNHRDWLSLINALKAKGIDVTFKKNADGAVRGIVFSCEKVSFAGGKVDRSLTYSNIAKALNGEQNISADSVATGENISHSNTISREISGGDSSATSTAAASSQDSYSDFSSEESGSTDSGNIVSNIAGAAVEAILQPNVAPSMGGGGGSSHSDDDDEKKKKKYKSAFRR